MKNSKIKSERLSIMELFREGWELYRANIKLIFLFTLLVFIPVNIILAFIPINDLIREDGRTGMIFKIILDLYQMLLSLIATIGIAMIVERSLQEIPFTWNDLLKQVLSKLPTTIGTGIFMGLILSILSLLLLFPAVIWSVYYSFTFYVVALRNIGGKKALNYSKNLVKGQWWRVLWVNLIIMIGELFIFMISHNFHLISGNRFYHFILSIIVDTLSAFFLVVSTVYFLNNDHLKKSPQKNDLPVIVDGA